VQNWKEFGVQLPPVCSTTPGLVEATEHGGITVIHSMRFEAVMEMVMELNTFIFNPYPAKVENMMSS
jgi:hypothetical protein